LDLFCGSSALQNFLQNDRSDCEWCSGDDQFIQPCGGTTGARACIFDPDGSVDENQDLFPPSGRAIVVCRIDEILTLKQTNIGAFVLSDEFSQCQVDKVPFCFDVGVFEGSLHQRLI
jgi:hypothetical protein